LIGKNGYKGDSLPLLIQKEERMRYPKKKKYINQKIGELLNNRPKMNNTVRNGANKCLGLLKLAA
jgi:hypothetical protein